MRNSIDTVINGKNVLECIDVEDGFLKYSNSDFSKVVSDPFFIDKGALFIYSGHDLSCIESAVESGAVVIYSSAKLKGNVFAENVFYTKSSQPLTKVINFIRNKSDSSFISVTGSVGKSTVKEMLGHVLSSFGSSVTNKGNRNGGNGIVEALGRVSSATEYSILEVASAAPGSIKKRNKIVNPDISIVTSVGESHLQNYSSRSELLQEKISLFQGLKKNGFAIINRKVLDEFPEVLGHIEEKPFRLLVVGGEQDGIYLKCIKKLSAHIEFKVMCYGEEFEVKLKSLASHDAINAMFVFAVGYVLNLDLNQVASVLSDFKGVGRRLEKIEVKVKDDKSVLLIDDSFNSSPTAVIGAIEAVSHLEKIGRKIFVFGDMLELSDDSAAEHIRIAKIIKESGFSVLATVGEASRSMFICNDNSFQVLHLDNYEEAVNFVVDHTVNDDLVLIKGSHATGLYKVVSELKKNKFVKSVRKI